MFFANAALTEGATKRQKYGKIPIALVPYTTSGRGQTRPFPVVLLGVNTGLRTRPLKPAILPFLVHSHWTTSMPLASTLFIPSFPTGEHTSKIYTPEKTLFLKASYPSLLKKNEDLCVIAIKKLCCKN